ncbi:hypothetical protein EB796_003060 [Bugula neritina]|uniref:SOCS box domain-containing protein n=1 Tax=Bugula neritina TaxID=10212 RepID=A0A7J7KKX9_BUGNE|nr:hypothetical protein EB796_003060 [Bugula neritina]
MISLKSVQCSLWNLWLWLIEIWEFLVLMTLGVHPARNILTLHRVSKETTEVVNTCLEVYSRSAVGSSLSQIKDLLSSCDPLSIAKLSTDSGYNLLQLAVLKSDIEFTEYLLAVKKVNPNICKCSLPLHIALRLGSVDMVRLLLSHKAKPQLPHGMCYPQAHVPVYSSHSKFFFVSPSMVCGGASKDAYKRAIDRDDTLFLQLLLQKKSSPRLNVVLLQYACSINAIRCVKHLVELWHVDVNCTDNRGYSSIMHSVDSNMEVIHYLVAQGAEVNLSSYKSQTLLHQLFCPEKEVVSHVVEKTKLFLALGADQIVNNYDVFRNTALHYLCIKYSLYGNTGHEYELRQCLGLFLSHNAETFLVDSDSCLPLQRLLQHPDSISSPKGVEAAADSELNSESADDLDQSPDPYHSHRIYMLLELFSQYSPSALHTVINKENETCMFYILRMSLDYVDQSYWPCIRLLQDNGANINHVAVTRPQGSSKSVRPGEVHIQSLLSIVRDKAMEELKIAANGTRCKLVISQTLKTLFQLGLDPNALHVQCSTSDQAENVKALAAFTQLLPGCSSASQLSLLKEWIRISLQWGANPDLQLYRCEPQICTSQGSIFLRQVTAIPITRCFHDSMARHWANHPEEMKRIALLLGSCMSHRVLQTTLSTTSASPTLLSQLSSYTTQPSEEQKDLTIFFHSLTSEPKSLQSLAQFQIYETLGRKAHPDLLKSLPIPSFLKSQISLETL